MILSVLNRICYQIRYLIGGVELSSKLD